MMEFRNWNLESPQDVDTFDSETQNNHRDSSNTIYAIGYEPTSQGEPKTIPGSPPGADPERNDSRHLRGMVLPGVPGRRPDHVRVLDIAYPR